MSGLMLRRVSNELVLNLRQLCIGREKLSVEIFGQRWNFTWSVLRSPIPGLIEFVADWGGARVIFRVSDIWFQRIASLVFQVDEIPYLYNLNALMRKIVTEVAIADASELIERSTRKRFSITSTDGHGSQLKDFFGFSVGMNDGNVEFHSEIWTDHLGIGFLANEARNLKRKSTPLRNWEELRFSLRFCIGWVQISTDALQAISKHDIILLDECFVGEDRRLVLQVANKAKFEAEIDGSTILIKDNLGKCMEDIESEKSIEEKNSLILDELSVRLYFDLGERSISLGELRSIRAGYIFSLGRDLRHSVSIRANGMLIGEGELVDVDGQTGVSVNSFHSNI